MRNVIVGLTISLDGFVTDRSGSVSPLYPDLEALRGTAYMNALIEQTGAVLMGRKTFEMAEDPDWYVGNYEFQVPIFVLTHEPPKVPPKQDENLTFTFVTTGVEAAVAQAAAAAREKAVQVVGGATVIEELLLAGLADELSVDVMPVFLGAGRRLFENVDLERIVVEKLSVQEAGVRTTLRFRVQNR